MPTAIWRQYKTSDLDACLALFKSNQQPFFASDEYQEFAQFLTHEVDDNTAPYFVLLQDDVVVGCGGYMQQGDTVFLTWGMVARDLHGQGLGRELVAGRIEKIREQLGLLPICIETSQHTAPIYQKLGFYEVKTTENGFAPGLHVVRMQFTSGTS
jgi:predicted GNAT family N-acyltransferase